MEEDLRTLFQVATCLVLASHFTWSLNNLTRYVAFNKCKGLSYVFMGAGCFYLSMSPFLSGPVSWAVISVLIGLTIVVLKTRDLEDTYIDGPKIVWTGRKKALLFGGSILTVSSFLAIHEFVIRVIVDNPFPFYP